jgi:hypothetical protein
MTDLGINVSDGVNTKEKLSQEPLPAIEGEELALLHNGEVVRRVVLTRPVRLFPGNAVTLTWKIEAGS